MSHISKVQIDIDQLSFSLKGDNRFFVNFFLYDKVTPESPVPDFHVDILDEMMDEDYPLYCCAVPRDHAKTTLAKLACVKYLLFTDYRFIVYISNTSDMASNALNDVAGFLKDENFVVYHRAICGRDVQWKIERTSHGQFEFVLFPGTAIEKYCILKSLGAGKQIRGLNVDNQRPELAIIDDLESNENLDTELGYKKLKKWFYGPFMKCMDKRRHKIVQLGNMVAYRCLIKDHTQSKFWKGKRYGAILSNGKPLWPEQWSIKKLKLDFELYKEQGQTDIWFAEMMNMPLADGMGLIKSDEINYLPPALPEDLTFGFLTVDPAISTKSWGHRTAICVHGFVNEKWQIVDSYAQPGMDPLKLFDKIIELSYKWKLNVVGIENVAYQASLKPLFQHFCLQNHIENMQFVDLIASARKTERFAAYCATIKAGLSGINIDDVLLTNQMLFYDPSRKDNDCDLLDAASYQVQMIARYMDIIMNTYRGSGEPMGQCIPCVEYSNV